MLWSSFERADVLLLWFLVISGDVTADVVDEDDAEAVVGVEPDGVALPDSLPPETNRLGFTRKSTFSGFKSVWMIEHSVCRKSKAINSCFVMIFTSGIGSPFDLYSLTMLSRLQPRISNTIPTSGHPV